MKATRGLDREGIIAALHELAALLELHGESKFKSRAYAKGARVLEASRADLGSLVGEGRLTDLPGIGTALARVIEQLHQTGTSELLETQRAKEAEHRASRSGKKNERRQQRLQKTVAKYEARTPGIMLADALALSDSIVEKTDEPVHLAGSVARGQELSPDLDLVVVTESPPKTLAAIAKRLRGVTNEKTGEDAMRLWLGDGTHLDVTAARYDDLPTVLAFEQSAEAHVAEARRARERARSTPRAARLVPGRGAGRAR